MPVLAQKDAEIERLMLWPIELAKVTGLGLEASPSQTADYIVTLTNDCLKKMRLLAQKDAEIERLKAENEQMYLSKRQYIDSHVEDYERIAELEEENAKLKACYSDNQVEKLDG